MSGVFLRFSTIVVVSKFDNGGIDAQQLITVFSGKMVEKVTNM